MTLFVLDKDALKKEQKEKKDAGYIFLGREWDAPFNENVNERVASIKTEAIAAKLIWEYKSEIVSIRSQGVTDAGDKFFVLNEQFGPWRDFYIKPGVLHELISYLDRIPEAVDAKVAHKEANERIHRKISKPRKKKTVDSQKKPQLESMELLAKEENEINKVMHLIEEASFRGDSLKKLDEESTSKKIYNESLAKEDRLLTHLFVSVPALLFLFALIIRALRDHESPAVLEISIMFLLCYSPLRYIFGKGLNGVASQFRHLLKVTVFSCIFMALISMCSDNGGSSSDCYYRVGCI